MNRKKVTSVIAVILTVIMIFSLLGSILPLTAHAVSESELDRLKQEKNEISGQVEDCRVRIETLREEQANVLERKAALEAQNTFANEQLNIVAREISAYDDLIADKSAELDEALNRENQQYERFRSRVRAMEESGGYNILALLFNAESFGELLTAIDDIECIMKSDRNLEQKYIEARENTEKVKSEYEAEKTEYEQQQTELRKEQKALEKEIEDAFAELDALAAEIKRAEEEQAAAEIQMEAAGAAIQQMINQLMEEKKHQNGQNGTPDAGGDTGSGGSGGSSDSGDSGQGGDSGGMNPGGASGNESFGWPVPCSSRVTSRFGPRIDPITGQVGRMHNGIDIDGFGNAGAPIVAAKSGTVVTAQYDPGYGNYVVIDHGSDKTLYAHMSGFAVSAGDWVDQGKTIGYLGDTGRATGVHCHYEMFINGSRVDPASYYSGLTFWNC